MTMDAEQPPGAGRAELARVDPARVDPARVDPGAAPQQPIGSYLRRQRELRGISAEELARVTRIPLRSLERLEAGSFDGEIDGFVRGFVRTVAVALGLDADETVARMLAEPVAEGAAGYVPPKRTPRALVALAVLAALLLAVGLVRIVASGDATPKSLPGGEIVYRVDPVRSLAESQAGVEASAPGAVASPPPPPTDPPTR